MTEIPKTENDRPQDDRRQYFRIQNSLFMSYQRIDQNADVQISSEIENTTLPSVRLLKDLTEIIEENTIFLSRLEESQTATEFHITKMNEKLASLNHYLVQELDDKYRELMDVDLSGGGIRFHSDVPFDVDQQIQLNLILVPEYYTLSSVGVVVDCQASKNSVSNDQSKINEGFELAISFIDIQESDRDAIIRHVFKRQSQELRAVSKEENEK